MNFQKNKVLLLTGLVTLGGVLPGLCERPDPSLLYFRGLGWELNDKPGWVGELLKGPDHDPIGMSFRLLRSHLPPLNGEVEIKGPSLCAFDGIGWTLRENFGYSGKLLLGPDRSLIGISFRVWNNALETPLVLMRHAGAPPFEIEIECGGKVVARTKPEKANPRPSESERVEWILPPRGKEEFFVPVRDLLPADFDPEKGKKCYLSAGVAVHPKGTPHMSHNPFPLFDTPELMLTKTGLAMDLKEALEHASATADKPH